ncbi:hypothetical protein Xfasm12_1877 [Xylella fastidiosa M12]|nr:hypothetical protein Xfasm12_1877 [Xylella fastidiosa M12]
MHFHACYTCTSKQSQHKIAAKTLVITGHDSREIVDAMSRSHTLNDVVTFPSPNYGNSATYWWERSQITLCALQDFYISPV